jgi:hypothetical protein
VSNKGQNAAIAGKPFLPLDASQWPLRRLIAQGQFNKPIHTVFQVSTSDALVSSVCYGEVSVQAILDHGGEAMKAQSFRWCLASCWRAPWGLTRARTLTDRSTGIERSIMRRIIQPSSRNGATRSTARHQPTLAPVTAASVPVAAVTRERLATAALWRWRAALTPDQARSVVL